MTPAQQRAMFQASWFEVSGRIARGEIRENREHELLALFIAATPTPKVRADLRSLDTLYAAARGEWSDDEYSKTRRLYTDAIATRKLDDPVAPWPQAQLDAAFAEVPEEERATKEAEVRKLHADITGRTAADAEMAQMLWLIVMIAACVFAFGSLLFSHPLARFTCFGGLALLCSPLRRFVPGPLIVKVVAGLVLFFLGALI